MRSKQRDDRESLSLPVDLMIEILMRLPPKSLARLSFVSKLWLSIIHERKFDLWILMDVKKHEWSKYSVIAPICDFFRCRGTIETGELIFEQLYYGDHFSILYYDPKEDKARRVDLDSRGDTKYIGRKLFLGHVESPMFVPRKFIH
ncbi:unnamed protein product [Eruca vesicaria subsp. sativa]|uniref:F-box domain-containing protein n=1 Tax=Eruca vesicaria subsp. sativa TaxID=29727 RepID=A0ABC8IRT2_ERUVS|nr:unnamed protein product [Eruca vesicaria subsp. sativa]